MFFLEITMSYIVRFLFLWNLYTLPKEAGLGWSYFGGGRWLLCSCLGRRIMKELPMLKPRKLRSGHRLMMLPPSHLDCASVLEAQAFLSFQI